MSAYRFPNITAGSEKEQLHQIKSYLYQLVEQLNYHTDPVSPAENTVSALRPAQTADTGPDFAQLKSMIIKSADIVDAYSEKLEKKLEGRYVAQSEFGTYAERTAGEITANSTKIEQKYQSLQTVITDLQTRLLETAGYIRTGVLFYAAEGDPLPAGVPVYGMEVGQQAENGEFRRFSRFTSYSLTFYDSAGNVFATITEGRLEIRHAAVTHTFALGGFADEVLPDGTLVTRWTGM